MKQSFVQLAHVYEPRKHSIAGKFMSEKLDGQRCIWDGGITRGLLKSDVPWANNDRDQRYKEPPIATGLWSRYGNVIHAPGWFLDRLPITPLDGELYIGRKKFQELRKIVADIVPGPGWSKVKLIALDIPPMEILLRPRTINETNFKRTIDKTTLQWYLDRGGFAGAKPNSTFEERLSILKGRFSPNDGVWYVHEQVALAFNTKEAERELADFTKAVLDGKGEGVILKSRSCLYETERVYGVLKHKPELDAEGTVVGYWWGALPDNTRTVSGAAAGKYVGLMGSLVLDYQGKTFKLSGFTDAERAMKFVESGDCAADEGIFNPGTFVAENIHNPHFPRGSTVTFTYRELSDEGVPKEARYMRRRDIE